MEGRTDLRGCSLARRDGHPAVSQCVGHRTSVRQTVVDRQDALGQVEPQVLDAGHVAQPRANLRDFVRAVHARHMEQIRLHCGLRVRRRPELRQCRRHGRDVIEPVRHGVATLLQVKAERFDPGNPAQSLADLALLARALHLLDVEDGVGGGPA